MGKQKVADEDVLAELPDLIESFEGVVSDLQTAETCEKQSDLRGCLLEARDALRLAACDLDELIAKTSN